MYVLATALAVVIGGCGGQGDHVSADEFPLVEGASIVKTRESPAVTTYIRRALVRGPDDLSNQQLAAAERSLLQSEGWAVRDTGSEGFERFKTVARSPDADVQVTFASARHAKRLDQKSGYNFVWPSETRELERRGVPVLSVQMAPLVDDY